MKPDPYQALKETHEATIITVDSTDTRGCVERKHARDDVHDVKAFKGILEVAKERKQVSECAHSGN